MRKLFVILFLLFSGYAEAAPPSRSFTYTTGTVISSSQVTANEDSLFNYLQAGVSVYEDLSIVNADIHSSANIQSDKLNLTAIAQSVANSGSTTLSGTFAANGTTNSIGNGGSDTLTLNVPGGLTLSAATTWTLTGALTFSGTIADLGTVTTANIDGGTLDGVQVGGTTATGELIVNDASDDADGLGSQGTSGQYLESAGAGANPVWANNSRSNVLFQYSGQVDAAGNGLGEYTGTSLVPSVTGNYRFLARRSDSYGTIWTAKWTKIAGINTVTILCRIWTRQAIGYNANLKVDIGGLNGNVAGTASQVTPEWKSFTIDVSSLTNGTVYDVTASLLTSTSDDSYCANIIGIGS